MILDTNDWVDVYVEESIDGAGDQRLASYTTWYEGPLSTELL